MKSYRSNLYQTLQHRLKIFFELYNNISNHTYLLPELFLKTLRDTNRFLMEQNAHSSCVEIAEKLDMLSSDKERMLIQEIERSLRKSKDYQELSTSYDTDLLLILAKKLEQALIKLNDHPYQEINNIR